MSLIHDFEQDLAWSEYPAQYVPYIQAIAYWWPDASWDRIKDIPQQKEAKDITITLSDGDVIHLQFKSRRACYLDCLIEYEHTYPSGYKKPGWINIPSSADYMLYCVPAGCVRGQTIPQRIYRVDYPSLHSAWIKHQNDWLHDKRFFHSHAQNTDYISWGVCVPWDVLASAGIVIDFLEFSAFGILAKAITTDTLQLSLLD